MEAEIVPFVAVEKESNPEIIELLDQTNLNWKVNKEALQTETGIIVPDNFAIVRDDTKDVLGVLGKNYVPYQNEELLELLFLISQSTGMKIHSGGFFGLGEKVWFQLESNVLDLGDDTVKGYLSGFNSFDGKTMLAFGNTNVTVSCLNTFHAGYREVDSKLRHSMNMKPRIDAILANIGILRKEEEQQFAQIKRLKHIGIGDGVKQQMIDTLFQIKPEEKIAGLSTRKKNQIEKFELDWAKEINQKGSTKWGAFSAVTRFTTHSMYKEHARGEEMKMFGKTGDIERNIWNRMTMPSSMAMAI